MFTIGFGPPARHPAVALSAEASIKSEVDHFSSTVYISVVILISFTTTAFPVFRVPRYTEPNVPNPIASTCVRPVRIFVAGEEASSDLYNVGMSESKVLVAEGEEEYRGWAGKRTLEEIDNIFKAPILELSERESQDDALLPSSTDSYRSAKCHGNLWDIRLSIREQAGKGNPELEPEDDVLLLL